VVLTEGEFVRNDDPGHDERATAALPPALRGAFVEEPRWVDLRWLHDVDQVDQSNPWLRECVADVAATVREVPKDVLVGEHIRQHRRTMRLARSGATALAVLLIVSVAAAVLAVVRGNQAVAAQHTAIARGMVAQADRIRDRDPRGCSSIRRRSRAVRHQPANPREPPADPRLNLPLQDSSQPHRRGVLGSLCPGRGHSGYRRRRPNCQVVGCQ
jgi:hypothetical protein